MVKKKKLDIRRAVYVTCVVAGSGEGAVPARVSLSVKRRRGCWPWPAASRQVALFTFGERPRLAHLPVSVTAPVDLEHLYKVQRKAAASAAVVKVSVEHRDGRRVARMGLDDFLGQLMRSGRPEWSFLHVYEEKVTLVQANQPVPGVVPEWHFDGAGKGYQAGEDDITQDKREDTIPEEKEQDNSKDTSQEEKEEEDNGKDNAQVGKEQENGEDNAPDVDKDSPEHTGEECEQDKDSEYLGHAWEECGRDCVGNNEKSPEHFGRSGRDRDGGDQQECEKDGDGFYEEGLEHRDEREGEDEDSLKGEEPAAVLNVVCTEKSAELFLPSYVGTYKGAESFLQGRVGTYKGADSFLQGRVGTYKGAKSFMPSEYAGDMRQKTVADLSMFGGSRCESRAWSVWRLVQRALLVIGVVMIVMVILDPLLPPVHEEVDWAGIEFRPELWGLKENGGEVRQWENMNLDKMLEKMEGILKKKL